jgi:HEPN domain-containing protein
MQDKVEYWLDLADDDMPVAKLLIEGKKYLHAGFFCHLIVEKALKAVVANVTTEVPPKTHDLRKLATIGGIFDSLSKEQLLLLMKLSPLHIDARYPEYKEKIAQSLSKEYCDKLFEEIEGFLCWIKQRLGKSQNNTPKE